MCSLQGNSSNSKLILMLLQTVCFSIPSKVGSISKNLPDREKTSTTAVGWQDRNDTGKHVVLWTPHDKIAHEAQHGLCCIIDTNFIPQYFLESGILTKIILKKDMALLSPLYLLRYSSCWKQLFGFLNSRGSDLHSFYPPIPSLIKVLKILFVSYAPASLSAAQLCFLHGYWPITVNRCAASTQTEVTDVLLPEKKKSCYFNEARGTQSTLTHLKNTLPFALLFCQVFLLFI